MSTSVVRALRILQLLAHAEKPLPLSRLSGDLGIPKSTAHSILASLTQEGFVENVDATGYSIGLKAFEVGAAHLRATGLVGVVAPELARLTRSLNITSHWAVLDGADVVYLCKEDPPGRGIRLASSVGARLPADVTAVGKSCLAWLEPDVMREHVTAQTNGSDAAPSPALVAEFERVRAAGYSTDDGEAATGIQCVAAPVFDLSGPRGAIGVSYLRGTGEVDSIIDEVRESASRATILLGGRTPA